MKRHGFTLIELLFVVATIAILAAIAVPNFLEAQIRAKISRTHQDMAALTSALRSYYADHNRYPQHRPEVQEFLAACAHLDDVNAQTTTAPLNAPYAWTKDDPHNQNRALTRGGEYTEVPPHHNFDAGFPILVPAGNDLRALTTPIAYAGTNLPTDPFADLKISPFVYINIADAPTTLPEWQKPGAFKRYVLLSYGPDTDQSEPDFRNPLKGPWLPYDPTNGTVSQGDVFQFGNYSPEPPASELQVKPEPSSNYGIDMPI